MTPSESQRAEMDRLNVEIKRLDAEAAIAMGYRIDPPRVEEGHLAIYGWVFNDKGDAVYWHPIGYDDIPWSPTTDANDALRLAEKVCKRMGVPLGWLIAGASFSESSAVFCVALTRAALFTAKGGWEGRNG